MKVIIKNIIQSFKISFKISKKFTILKIVDIIINSLLIILKLNIFKNILNEIQLIFSNSGNLQKIILFSIIYLIMFIYEKMNSILMIYYENWFDEKVRLFIDEQLIDKISNSELSYFDDTKQSNITSIVKSEIGNVIDNCWNAFSLIASFFNIFSLIIVSLSFNFIIFFILLIIIFFIFLVNVKFSNELYEQKKSDALKDRESDYYRSSFENENVQLENKVNNFGDYFIKKYKSIKRSIIQKNNNIKKRFLIKKTFLYILTYICEILYSITYIPKVIKSIMPIGDFEYNLNIIEQVRTNCNNFSSLCVSFIINNKKIEYVNEFLLMNSITETNGQKICTEITKIEFQNVSFKYPNEKKYVLKDCSFVIDSNDKIAIIGLNGCGKSTIIKLLLKFYTPASGTILINGININDYKLSTLRNQINILFQDYVKYCLPCREAIALSNFDDVNNDEKLDCATIKSNFYNIIATWPKKYDTVFGKYYADEGIDLSGGQWQLLSLSRTYFKDSSVICLDEPSASLDIMSEKKVFDNVLEISKDKILIAITHQLRNVEKFNKIYLIEDGNVKESGDHQFLLSLNGRYKELYDIQKNLGEKSEI